MTDAGVVYLFEGAGLVDLDPLARLSGLKWASLANNQIESVAQLQALDQLAYLSLADNRIGAIDAMIGQPLLDDGDQGFGTSGFLWQRNQSPVGSYDADYHIHSTENATEVATWRFDGLAPGTYQIFATWVEHDSRASAAPYTIVTQIALPGANF